MMHISLRSWRLAGYGSLLICTACSDSPSNLSSMITPTETQTMLTRHYPPDRLTEDRVMYDPAEALLPLTDLPALSQLLPDTRFYRTAMATDYESYHRVDVIVAQPPAGEPVVLWSPLFRNDSPEFTDRFVGRKPAVSLRDSLGAGLAALYASLYPGGTVATDREEDSLSYTLLRDGRAFRKLSVRLSEAGVITGVICSPALPDKN